MPVTVRQYDDFDLQVRPFQDGDFEAAVLRSPAGEARQPFTLPQSPAEMAALLPEIEAAIAGGNDSGVAQAMRFGAMLFTALFTGKLLQLFDQSLSHAQSRGRDLRIRLRVLDDPLLAALPWELLYDTREQRFIALRPDVVLTRTVEAQQPARDLAMAPPLRVLAMASQPSDMAALDLDRERAQLERSLARLGAGVELRWVDGQSWRALHDALQQADWHVFHFLGHGLFDRTAGSGALAFAGDDGLAELHTAEELSRLLGDHDALRLVVLNACEGAQDGGSQMDAGIAQQLVRAGVPAVVAMQGPIRDTHAAELTRSFYGALGNGLAIDAAFAEARKALSLAAPGALAWAVPVLVMRSGDSRFAVQDKRLQWDGRNPYRGLETFQEADAEFFFGRERLVDELVDRLADARFVCVAGPSGSGKSSLVQAGLLYALKQGRIAKSEHWLYATASPSTAPLDELARAVARAGKTPIAAEYIRKNAVQDGTALCTQVETLLTHDRQQRFVLYVDQFEELFTQTSAESERIAFLAQLTTAAEKTDCRTIVIVSIRSDFLSQCSAYPALRELINRQFFLVGEMQPEELEQAIVQPALAVGAGVEPELIDKITAEMDGEPGALPLMEFALRDLFESETVKKQAGDAVTLTLDAYLRRGGIRKALRRHADRVFKTLTPEQQVLTRSLFTFLVEVGVGAQPTRRTATVDALQHLGKPQAVDAVLQALADARLLTTSSPANGDAGTVTVAHERLLSSWPWLEKLIDENREAIYLQNIVARDASEWAKNDRDISYLYAGARLATIEEMLSDERLQPSAHSFEFIQESVAEARRKSLAEVEMHRKELAREKMLRNRLRLLLVMALALLVVMVGATILIQARNKLLQATTLEAEVNELVAETRYSLSQVNPNTQQALRDGIQALSMATELSGGPRYAAEDVVHDVLQQARLDGTIPLDNYFIQDMEQSDGLVAGAASDGSVRLWQADETGLLVPQRSLYCDSGAVANKVALGGRQVAVATDGGMVCVWNLDTRERLFRQQINSTYIDLSDDGQILATASGDWVRIWVVVTGQQIDDFHAGAGVIFDIDFQHTGSFLVALARNGIVVRDYRTRSAVWETNPDEPASRFSIGQGGHLALSHDDIWMAVTRDEEILVWKQQPTDDSFSNYSIYDRLNTAHSATITAANFSANGRCLATASDDQTIKIWETENRRLRFVLSGHVATPTSVVFGSPPPATAASDASMCGTELFSAGEDKTIKQWNVGASRDLLTIPLSASFVESIAVSPNSDVSLFAAVDGNGLLTLVDYETGLIRTQQQVHDLRGNHVAFSPGEGRYVASAGDDHFIVVYDTVDDMEFARFDTHTGAIQAVAFGLSGSVVASGGEDRSIKFWDIHTQQQARAPIDVPWPIWSLEYGPTGGIIAMGTEHDVRILDAETGKETIILDADKDGKRILDIEFSSKGNWLAAANERGTVDIWQLPESFERSYLTNPMKSLLSDSGPVYSLALSPNGELLAATTNAGEILVYQTEDWTQRLRLGTDTTDQEMNSVAFSLDSQLLLAACEDGTVRVYRIDPIEDLLELAKERLIPYTQLDSR